MASLSWNGTSRDSSSPLRSAPDGDDLVVSSAHRMIGLSIYRFILSVHLLIGSPDGSDCEPGTLDLLVASRIPSPASRALLTPDSQPISFQQYFGFASIIA